MIGWLGSFWETLLGTLRDVLPIAAIIIGFQVFVIRKPVHHPKQLMIGFTYVLLGIALFLEGLELALFPLGELMAKQLTAPEFIQVDASLGTVPWQAYFWVYIFAGSIGFATTLAEPALIAVAIKAQEISGGAIRALGLRLAVSVGVAFGISLGAYRIISGTDLYLYIIAGYGIVIVQTAFAPKMIIGLAYDSGGVTTSTVTVPLVTALGLGLASTVPGRNPMLDGFGLIAFASLFPIISVLGYAQLADWRSRRMGSKNKH
ncbi:MAG: DUF1538 domain-containing protein [Methylococcales bacterium]